MAAIVARLAPGLDAGAAVRLCVTSIMGQGLVLPGDAAGAPARVRAGDVVHAGVHPATSAAHITDFSLGGIERRRRAHKRSGRAR